MNISTEDVPIQDRKQFEENWDRIFPPKDKRNEERRPRKKDR